MALSLRAAGSFGAFWIVLALLSFALVSPMPLRAQVDPAAPVEVDSLAEVDSLSRVRLARRTALPRRVSGRLVSIDSQAIAVEHEGGFVVVPLSEVTRLDVSLGPRPPLGAWKGAQQGFLAGVVFTAFFYALGAVVDARSDCDECYFTMRGLALAGAVPVTVLSTGIGAATVDLSRKERWQRVPLPARVRSPAAATAEPNDTTAAGSEPGR
jgi:hypothetical protein